MTPEQAAAAAKRAVNALGLAFMDGPDTLRRARRLGLTGGVCYIVGRAGVLGDHGPDVMAAALGLVAPDSVRAAWAAASVVLPPSELAIMMREECCRWGENHLAPVPLVHRLVSLAESVVREADPTGLPLFAAWRAMPVPDDGPDGLGARAAVALHLLHEHRAGAHLLGLRASDLSPVEALIAGPGGEETAAAFGWHGPYPSPVPLVRKRVWADAIADRLTGQAWRVLSVKERVELVGLLNETTQHIRLG